MERLRILLQAIAVIIFTLITVVSSPVASCEFKSSLDHNPDFSLDGSGLGKFEIERQNHQILNSECFSSETFQKPNYELILKPFSSEAGTSSLQFSINADEIKNLTVSDEVKKLMELSNTLPMMLDNKAFAEKEQLARGNLNKIVKEAFTVKDGIWFPENGNSKLLPALNEAYKQVYPNNATNNEFNEYLTKTLNQPVETKILGYDPTLPFDFNVCPDCQIIGGNGLVPFDKIEDLAVSTLASLPREISSIVLPKVIDFNFSEQVKKLASATVVMTVRSRVKHDASGTYLSLPIGGFCQKKISKHCSAFPNKSGSGIYTANHCVQTLLEGYQIDAHLMDLEIGQTKSCSDDNPLRFIKDINKARIGKHFDDSSVSQCKTVTRLSEDSVFIDLTGEITPLPAEISDLLLFPNELKQNEQLEMEATQRYRRTIGFGFAHTQDLVLSNGGYVSNNQSCRRTFDEISHGFQIPSHDPLKTGVGDFLCVSTDSLNGMSGGPIFSIMEQSKFAMLGVFSFAYGSTRASECTMRKLKSIEENTEKMNGSFNVVSRL